MTAPVQRDHVAARIAATVRVFEMSKPAPAPATSSVIVRVTREGQEGSPLPAQISRPAALGARRAAMATLAIEVVLGAAQAARAAALGAHLEVVHVAPARGARAS